MIWIRLNAAKPTTRQKGRSIQRIFSWVLALLCLVAAALMLLHLKPKESIPVDERAQARKEKNWKRSDELRDQIKAMGYILEDTAAGQKVRKGV